MHQCQLSPWNQLVRLPVYQGEKALANFPAADNRELARAPLMPALVIAVRGVVV